MQIIPFDGNKALPDYFQAFDLSALNAAFVTANAGFIQANGAFTTANAAATTGKAIAMSIVFGG